MGGGEFRPGRWEKGDSPGEKNKGLARRGDGGGELAENKSARASAIVSLLRGFQTQGKSYETLAEIKYRLKMDVDRRVHLLRLDASRDFCLVPSFVHCSTTCTLRLGLCLDPAMYTATSPPPYISLHVILEYPGGQIEPAVQISQ